MTVTRLGSASMYDRTINNINKQQAELTSQMEHSSAAKRVIRASDDPVAAAQAERARTRLSRSDTDQRMLDAQTATVKYGDSTLQEITTAVQEFRSLLVQAGNGTYNQTQRDTLVEQLQSLRDQILSYANRTDSNGLPLFRGLDTQSSTPFPNGSSGIQSGQTNSSDYSITNSLNGALAFFSGKTGNGVLAVESGALNPLYPAPGESQFIQNQGKAWANVGTITDAAAADAAPMPLQITFADDNGVLSYSLDGGPLVPYKSGEPITVAGMSLTITGEPVVGDAFTVDHSQDQSVFEVLDQAIASVKNAGNVDGSTNYGALAHAMAKAQAEIDTQLNRISTVQGMAGDLLNQADRMGTTLLALDEQLEAQRSSAEDLNMVKALSKLKTQEVAVSAALQSYTSIQKLSLFNFIN